MAASIFISPGSVTTGSISITGTLTLPGGATLVTTSAALTNNAGLGTGSLGNAPSSTDPTKWIAINDNGTVRFIPTWT